MAKSDTPVDEIDLSRAFGPPHTPKWADDTHINAFDTETHDGEPFLLSVAWHDDTAQVYPGNGPKILDAQAIWDVVTHHEARSAINVWYNLSFDADVIVSTVLNRDELGSLALTGNVETEDDYQISYIPAKFLEIKDPNNHSYVHYDIAQFFYGTLESAVQEWLPDQEKRTDLIDASRFGSGESWSASQAWEYIEENYQDIRKYAKEDAIITRDLWREATRVGESLDIPMGRPYSTGYLAESYLNSELGQKPGLGPKEVYPMAWDAYRGGRFEILKRGDVGEVAGPDINSAYPYVLSNLPDPKTLTWYVAEDATIDQIREAEYGFVNATVTTDSTRPIQPFAVKMNDEKRVRQGGKLKYPALTRQEITTIKPIFELAHEYDYLDDYYIHSAVLATDSQHADFPFDFIPQKYHERKTYAADGRDKLELFLKIVLNSMYGKMCQTTPKRRPNDQKEYILEEYETFVTDQQIPPDLREIFDGGIIEKLEAGAWFNPFLASYITGMTRHELHSRILEYGLEDNTIMLATDSIMVEREPFEKSGFAADLVPDDSVPYREQLGMWDYDYQGKAFVVGAGVYEVDMGDKVKTKTRGFKEADLDGRLREEIERVSDAIDIRTNRPVTAKEAIWHGQSLSDVSTFTDFERELRADMDDKRVWDGPATFDAFLDATQTSKPIDLRP